MLLMYHGTKNEFVFCPHAGIIVITDTLAAPIHTDSIC